MAIDSSLLTQNGRPVDWLNAHCATTFSLGQTKALPCTKSRLSGYTLAQILQQLSEIPQLFDTVDIAATLLRVCVMIQQNNDSQGSLEHRPCLGTCQEFSKERLGLLFFLSQDG